MNFFYAQKKTDEFIVGLCYRLGFNQLVVVDAAT